MTPRPPRASARSKAGPATRGSGRRLITPARLIALVVIGLGVIALVAMRRPGKPTSAPDPLAGMPAIAAADSADRLIDRGRSLAAIPYLEHLEQAGIEATSEFHERVAGVLNNAAIEVHEADGLKVSAARSTIEKIELIQHALVRLELAEQQATRPEQRRDIIVGRGGLLAAWGFVREGYLEYRRANSELPLERRRINEAGWLETMFHNPTTVLPAAPNPAP